MTASHHPYLLLALLLVAGALTLSACRPAAPDGPHTHSMISEDDTIVFFGDSITEAGDEPGGYVSIVRDSLHARYPGGSLEVIGAGISGNRVPDLVERLDRDVLNHDPSLVVIYIGINDVWHQFREDPRGTDRDTYRAGLEQLVNRIQADGADVMLCTPSVIGENMHDRSAENIRLAEYADISRAVADAHDVPVCDLHAAFREYLEQHNPEGHDEGILTTDRVHLNEAGNRFVAGQMLEALGR